MATRAVISLDVGGTTIDAACVRADGDLIGGVSGSGSPSAGTRDEVVAELAQVIAAARAQAEDASVAVVGCGIAFPAPFDYAAGVSHMTHKFQAVNGMNLGDALRERAGLPVSFLNDADAFGLGVGWRQLPDVDRFVALTIGTGLGSGFIARGRAVTGGGTVPAGGEVWSLPYRGGIVEDYVSARAVTSCYQQGEPGHVRSAKEVAELAAGGDPAAVEAFRVMGEALGAALAPVLAGFGPEAVVIGGKVGRSLGLFGPALRAALADGGLPGLPVVPADPGNMAIWGAARHALDQFG